MTVQSDMALMAAGSYWDVRNGEIDPQTSLGSGLAIKQITN